MAIPVMYITKALGYTPFACMKSYKPVFCASTHVPVGQTHVATAWL